MISWQQAYFQRIGYFGATEPTLANLRSIHRSHMMAVPFENLDIHIGRWIELDEGRLFHKIVRERRGGFCFEQNGLFSSLLRGLGYDVTRIEANVHIGDGKYSIPMDHMALIVRLDGQRWLADVGFGDSFLEPLNLDTTEPQIQGPAAYKISIEGTTGYMMKREADGKWSIQYRFFFNAHELADYAEACHYMQTSPQSTFTQKRVCTLATPAGRITVSNQRFIVTQNGVRTESEISSDDEWELILREKFGIDLEPARQGANRNLQPQSSP